MVETHALTKCYGAFAALSDCTMEIDAGQIFGLLGPNGAGKTTLLRLLLGFLKPTRGQAFVAGRDCFRQSVSVRQQLAYMPAEAKLFRRMRASDVLRFFADLRGQQGDLNRALRLAGRLDLDTRGRVASMSTGTRQKLALAVTLAHDAPLLILDEPTASLDPNVRHEVLKILAELRMEGRTILLSSHVLSEIEEACDRVVILRQGRIVHSQVMSTLRLRHRIQARASASPLEIPTALQPQVSLTQKGDWLQIETEGDLGQVLPWLATLGLHDVRIEPYGLRSVYEQFHGAEDAA